MSDKSTSDVLYDIQNISLTISSLSRAYQNLDCLNLPSGYVNPARTTIQNTILETVSKLEGILEEKKVFTGECSVNEDVGSEYWNEDFDEESEDEKNNNILITENNIFDSIAIAIDKVIEEFKNKYRIHNNDISIFVTEKSGDFLFDHPEFSLKGNNTGEWRYGWKICRVEKLDVVEFLVYPDNGDYLVINADFKITIYDKNDKGMPLKNRFGKIIDEKVGTAVLIDL